MHEKAAPPQDGAARFFAMRFEGLRAYTMPWAIMASASFLKPAMFAPMT